MVDIAYVIGRVAIPILFIISGIGKFLNVSGISNHPGVTNFMNAFGEITTRTTLGYIIATIEVVGGISVLIGLKTRWGAIALILFLDAKESAQRADDQRNHDRGSATAIEVRTDRNRDLRHDNADNASNHHQSAKHRDDDAPVAEFQFRYNNRFNPDIFGTAIAGC